MGQTAGGRGERDQASSQQSPEFEPLFPLSQEVSQGGEGRSARGRDGGRVEKERGLRLEEAERDEGFDWKRGEGRHLLAESLEVKDVVGGDDARKLLVPVPTWHRGEGGG